MILLVLVLCRGYRDGTNDASALHEDTKIIEQIDRDVKRTHPDMHFISGDSASAKANQLVVAFGSVIASTTSAPPAVGVDLNAEKRYTS
ncbi:Rab-GTPase-TBC domain-containing protein [Tanacetum coccineum]